MPPHERHHPAGPPRSVGKGYPEAGVVGQASRAGLGGGSMTNLVVMDDQERESMRMRLEIVRGVLNALGSWSATCSAIWEAADRQAAVAALQREVGLTEIVAHYVLDLSQGRTTRQARADLAEEAAELARLLEDG